MEAGGAEGESKCPRRRRQGDDGENGNMEKAPAAPGGGGGGGGLRERMAALVDEFGLDACRGCLGVAVEERGRINEAVLEASFDGILIVDETGVVVSCNRAASKIFGYGDDGDDGAGDSDNDNDGSGNGQQSDNDCEGEDGAGERLTGRHVLDLVGGSDPESHRRHFDDPPEPLPGTRILAHMRDVPARHKSGAEFRVTVGLCYLDLDGGKRRYVAFVRDLTERKRQDELQQATFNASFDPIVLTDAYGVIQTVNNALLDDFGYAEASDLVGQSITRLMPQKHASHHAQFMKKFRDRVDVSRLTQVRGGVMMKETTAVRKDGTEFPIKVGVQTIRADHVHELHLVGYIRDVTDENRAMEVSRVVGEMRAQDAKVGMEREMTAYFAHELRNPLGAIDSALATMPDDLASNVREARELHDSIRLCSDFMSRTMGNLLDVRQMEEGRMTLNPGPVDLERLLRGVHAMLLPSVKAGVDFRCVVDDGVAGTGGGAVAGADGGADDNGRPRGGKWVTGDAHRLRQVLTNVATRAIKSTSSGSVCLSVRWTDDEAEGGAAAVRFECADTGPGIPEDERAELFERFVGRGRGCGRRARRTPGTGLGLAIAKNIVDFMGGEIRIESGCGGGGDPSEAAAAAGTLSGTTTRVVAVLPLRPTVAPGGEVADDDKVVPSPDRKSGAATTVAAAPPIQGKLNVLVVDDIKMNRKMVSRRFKKIAPHCTVSEACTGEEALEKCERERFDVVIMDNYMEDAGGVMHGTDAVAAMRADADNTAPPLIIGCSGNDLEKEFREAGADFFWSKPLPSDEEIVRQVLQAGSAARRRRARMQETEGG